MVTTLSRENERARKNIKYSIYYMMYTFSLFHSIFASCTLLTPPFSPPPSILTRNLLTGNIITFIRQVNLIEISLNMNIVVVVVVFVMVVIALLEIMFFFPIPGKAYST